MVDYSKWGKIEISDDEDDTHPNIDTASLFRWRHSARLERAQTEQSTRAQLAAKRAELTTKLAEGVDGEEQTKLKAELDKLETEVAQLDRRARLQPWNVDTISADSWSATVLNKQCLQDGGQSGLAAADRTAEITDQQLTDYESHVRQYEPLIKQFAFHSRFDDCRRFLVANPNLVSAYTLDYMSLWCMHLQLDGKRDLLDHVAGQAVMIQLILDLAKTAGKGIDPRSCLTVFFERSAGAKDKFTQLYKDELREFKSRVEQAAEIRLQHELDKHEAEKQAAAAAAAAGEDSDTAPSVAPLVGPGGLDTQQVFDSLPPELQDCFVSRSREQLHQVLAAMPPDQAEYHLQRCIDAGLWTTEQVDDDDDRLMDEIRARTEKCAVAGDVDWTGVDKADDEEDDEDGDEHGDEDDGDVRVSEDGLSEAELGQSVEDETEEQLEELDSP